MNRLLAFIASIGVAFVMISFTASANASAAMLAFQASTSDDVTASADCGGDGGVASWGMTSWESVSGSSLELL